MSAPDHVTSPNATAYLERGAGAVRPPLGAEPAPEMTLYCGVRCSRCGAVHFCRAELDPSKRYLICCHECMARVRFTARSVAGWLCCRPRAATRAVSIVDDLDRPTPLRTVVGEIRVASRARRSAA